MNTLKMNTLKMNTLKITLFILNNYRLCIFVYILLLQSMFLKDYHASCMEGSLPILDGKTPFDRGDSCLVNEVISNPTNHSSSLPISLPGIILGGFPSGKVDSVTSNTLINVDPTLLFSGDSFQNLIDVFEGNGFLQEALHGFQRSLDLSQPITLLMNPLGSHIV